VSGGGAGGGGGGGGGGGVWAGEGGVESTLLNARQRRTLRRACERALAALAVGGGGDFL